MSALHEINGRRLHIASTIIVLAGLVFGLLVSVAATLETSSRTAWSPNLTKGHAKVDAINLDNSIPAPGA